MPGSGGFVRRFVRVLRGGFECKISFQFFDGFLGGIRGGFWANFVADFVSDFEFVFLSKEIRTKRGGYKRSEQNNPKIYVKKNKLISSPSPLTRNSPAQ